MSSNRTPDTPGYRAVVNIDAQNQALSIFKKPLGSVTRKPKPKILTEEKYVEEMSKIIQRDFFPDLDKLRAQNEYLEAESRKDYTLMAAIRAKYTGSIPRRNTHSRNSSHMSPATFETPASIGKSTPRPGDDNTPSSISSKTSKRSNTEKNGDADGTNAPISSNMSLDAFLQHYTSEDNHSFQEIIETSEKKLRQKFAVLYKHEQLSADQLQRALTLPSIEQQFDQPDPMRKIETWKYTNMNSIMYVPDGVELSDEEQVQAVARKQIIQHSATRLNDLDTTIAEDNNIDNSNSAAKTNSVVIPGAAAAPQIRGYELLKTPSPRPGADFSPIMTWGEIEGTPFRLDGGDTPLRTQSGPSFKINENSRRENIAIALADKVGAKMRAEKQQALNTARKNIGSPFIRSNMERLASMSPAAQRLATNRLGLRSVTPFGALTPSPLPPGAVKRKNQTPKIAKHTLSERKKTDKTPAAAAEANTLKVPIKTKSSIDTGSTLTDDLLQIPTKRRQAADFF